MITFKICVWLAQVEKVQSELDDLAATLKQVELYNEQTKGEIAVTRRWGPIQLMLMHQPGLGLCQFLQQGAFGRL